MVVSTTLEGRLDWPDATVVSGDAVDVVARLKEESGVPLRSHGSLSLNRALMAAAWSTGPGDALPGHHRSDRADPIFQGAADFDLELIESRTLDSHIQSSSTGPPSTDRYGFESGSNRRRVSTREAMVQAGRCRGSAPSTVDRLWRKMPRKVRPYGSGDDIEAAALARSRRNPAPGYVNELAATMTIGEVATQAVEAVRALNQLMADGGELAGRARPARSSASWR